MLENFRANVLKSNQAKIWVSKSYQSRRSSLELNPVKVLALTISVPAAHFTKLTTDGK